MGLDTEKPLLQVGGVPMVDRVIGALEDSRVGTVHAVTSPHAPETAAHLEGRVPVVETPGDGYVEDLTLALERVDPPVLTVVADLPLLAAGPVDRVIEHYGKGGERNPSVTVCVPTALKRALGVSADTTRAHGGRELSPSGLNVVGEGEDEEAETLQVSYDARLAVNVNRPADLAVAEVLAGGP